MRYHVYSRRLGLTLFAVAIILILALTYRGLTQTPPPLNVTPAALPAPLPYLIAFIREQRIDDTHEVGHAEVANSGTGGAPSDLCLLDTTSGTVKVLVAGNGDSLQDLARSFDGKTLYFTRHKSGLFSGQKQSMGSDIYAVNIASGAVTQLTNGGLQPNRAVDDAVKPGMYLSGTYPVVNSCPTLLSNGRIMFCSNRNMYQPVKRNTFVQLDLFTMDPDGSNVEKVGYMNLGSAMHPVQLRNGQVMFSSYECQGIRDVRAWSLWLIDTDGTSWGPAISQLTNNFGIHFQCQLSDGRLVAIVYYNLNDDGAGTVIACAEPGSVTPAFGPAGQTPYPTGGAGTGPVGLRFPPAGLQTLTPFTLAEDVPAPLSNPADTTSARVGKFTTPAAGLNSDLLISWSPGPVNHDNTLWTPSANFGLYLIPGGKPISDPSQMQLIYSDPKYNALWATPVGITYQDIYGIPAPVNQPELGNDGTVSKFLPTACPFSLAGTATMYKRESFPDGVVAPGSVTAGWDGKTGSAIYQGLPPFYSTLSPWQGTDLGKYQNSDIHAIRILLQEPYTDHALTDQNWRNGMVNQNLRERFKIVGEFPVRHFDATGKQATDPDGNPDTSWAARLIANGSYYWQALNKDGQALNISQTWHQFMPGEVRTNCGGCHAHSQIGTNFALTAAAAPTYSPFDATSRTYLLSDKASDQSGQQWDTDNSTGLISTTSGPLTVEFYKDVWPILSRSCVACHQGAAPAGGLDLSWDGKTFIPYYQAGGNGPAVPPVYQRLANNPTGQYGGIKPLSWASCSRYIALLSSLRSPFMWKVLGKRTDGWQNADHPTETTPGDPTTLPATWTSPDGKVTLTGQQVLQNADVDFNGKQCPQPGATDANGNLIPPLSDADKRTLARWIDTGCPIDCNGKGAWAQDETPPTVYLASPQRGINTGPLTGFTLGMADYSGLDLATFSVTTDFAVDGAAPGTNLAGKFAAGDNGVWRYAFTTPIASLAVGNINVFVADKAGNRTRFTRKFAVSPPTPPPPPPNPFPGQLQNLIAELQAIQQMPNPGNPPTAWLNPLAQANTDLEALLKAIKAPQVQMKRAGKVPRIPQPWRQSPKGKTAVAKVWQPLPLKKGGK